jgi:predicted  nucleic acid-binding Zn-ribbon protein
MSLHLSLGYIISSMPEDSKTLRDIAQTLLDSSERLKKEAEELNRRAQEIETAINKTKKTSGQSPAQNR